MARTGPGATPLMLSSIGWTDCRPNSPTSDTSTSSPGKMESTE